MTMVEIQESLSLSTEEEHQCQMIIAPIYGGEECVNSAQWVMHVRKNCTCRIITSMLVCDSCHEQNRYVNPVCCGCKKAVTITWVERTK